MKKDYSKLWTLFKSMFVLSACTFGGGFVIVSLMKKKYVEELKWMEEDEMLDVTAITQSAPGPLPVNASVIIGYRIAGVAGSLTAILGTILPPMVIISVISLFYEQFRTNPYIATALQVMRAGVAAVIFDVVINLAGNVVKTGRIFYMTMMVVAFVSAYLLDVSAMIIIFRLPWDRSGRSVLQSQKEQGRESFGVQYAKVQKYQIKTCEISIKMTIRIKQISE